MKVKIAKGKTWGWEALIGMFWCYLGGGFIFLIFTPKIGEMILFDSYVSNGLKPPTSYFLGHSSLKHLPKS